MIQDQEFEQALSRLAGLARFGVKLGLERMERLLAKLGNPERDLAVVHLAGTNGKGSTAAFLEAGLLGAGVRTGLYTSPHLCRFTERIRVAGAEIPRDDLCRLLDRVMTAAGDEATFFEVVTALALVHFAEQGVELAVLETGLGGRLDATNVVTPTLAIITPIHLDHTEVLGPDLEAIAGEKAGIIKPGAQTLAAPPTSPAVRRVLEERAAACGNPPVRWQGVDFPVEAAGPRAPFQRQNLALAMEALEQLRGAGWAIPRPAAEQAMAAAHWPGRLEPAGHGVLLDGAHNPDGCAALVRALGDRGQWDIVLGLLQPRSPHEMAAALAPLARRFIFTAPRSPRAVDPEAFSDPGVPAVVTPNLTAALGEALRIPGRTLVTGSLYLVGEARTLLLGEPADQVDAFDPAPFSPEK